MLDQNFGTEADLKALIDEAHAQGIRVLVDVVLNHPGYATGDDLLALPAHGLQGRDRRRLRAPGRRAGQPGQTWNDLNNFVDYQRAELGRTGGARAGSGPASPRFQTGGQHRRLTMQLTFLPDFKTETAGAAGVPDLFSAGLGAPEDAHQLRGDPRRHGPRLPGEVAHRLGPQARHRRLPLRHRQATSRWRAGRRSRWPATNALADWKLANPALRRRRRALLDDRRGLRPRRRQGRLLHGGRLRLAHQLRLPAARARLLLPAPTATLAGGAGHARPPLPAATPTPSPPTRPSTRSPTSPPTTPSSSTREMGYDPVRQRQALTALLLVPGGAQLFYGDESGRRLGPTAATPPRGPAPT